MNIVVDTTIFLAIALNEPENKRIIELTSETSAIAPEILPYEIGNALSAMNKRKRISYDEALSALEITNLIPVRLVTIDIQKALKIAFDYNIYAYDAYFLQCAKSFACPLITLDKRMKQVAIDINIDLLE